MHDLRCHLLPVIDDAGVPAIIAVLLGAAALTPSSRGLLGQSAHARGLGVTALVALVAVLAGAAAQTNDNLA
ncbi:hypothetical protein [Luteimonas terricola]|uniref:hypothetical protein n=1 Tax=Luteimonas terricola TaxID=645597 RepID=UPI001A9F09A3|nr:hypothetical protein [Luteimonas terricola]